MANDGFEVLGEIVLELVPRYLGAFLKWIYCGFKTPFSKILEEKGTMGIGYVAFGILLLLMLALFNL